MVMPVNIHHSQESVSIAVSSYVFEDLLTGSVFAAAVTPSAAAVTPLTAAVTPSAIAAMRVVVEW